MWNHMFGYISPCLVCQSFWIVSKWDFNNLKNQAIEMILTWDFTPECHPGVSPRSHFYSTGKLLSCAVKKKGWFDRSQFMLFLRCWGDILSHPADNQSLLFLFNACSTGIWYLYIIACLQDPVVCLESCTSAQNVSFDKYLLKGQSFDSKTFHST